MLIRVFIVSVFLGFVGLLHSEIDTKTFFDVSSSCNMKPLGDMVTVSDTMVKGSITGAVGVASSTKTNEIPGYNVGGTSY